MSNAILRRLAALADRYHADGKIGHGGMATVYAARNLRHNCLVALKVLRPGLPPQHHLAPGGDLRPGDGRGHRMVT